MAIHAGPVRHLLTREDLAFILEMVSEWCNTNPNVQDLSSSTPLIEELFSRLHDIGGQHIN